MTIPNLITTLRIILTPIFIIYLLNDQFLAALVVLCLCGISDGLDGLFARWLNQKSTLGAYLDPIADKLILVSAFVALSVRGALPPWLSVTVITRDVLILLGVLFMMLYQMEIIIRPSLVSKFTTCLQFVTVIGVLAAAYLEFPEGMFPVLFRVTGAFTIISGLHYIQTWFKMMGGREGRG
ncbi:MAG: CDP-alcohol phosphatidyltransferase family protein [Desulfobacteraceae bacterium]